MPSCEIDSSGVSTVGGLTSGAAAPGKVPGRRAGRNQRHDRLVPPRHLNAQRVDSALLTALLSEKRGSPAKELTEEEAVIAGYVPCAFPGW